MPKQYLNIQEQVQKNKDDIEYIITQRGVLNEFGLKVVDQIDDISELPTVAEYKEAHEDWNYGDTIAVGTEEPYELYILTRANSSHPNDYWFDLGEFPLAGPQGEPGEEGPEGQPGVDATITGATVTVDSDSTGTPSASVTLGGTPGARTFAFSFSNLKGNTGPQGDPGAFFNIVGQVANSSLLPAASEVGSTAAYLVGTTAPYDVYCIMTTGGVKSWINLGPVAVIETDTKVGSNTYAVTGTLNSVILDEIINNVSMDFIKIGNVFFSKHSPGYYYGILNNSGTIVIYTMVINLSTGEWEITTKSLGNIAEVNANNIFTGSNQFTQAINLLNNNNRIEGATETGDNVINIYVDNFQALKIKKDAVLPFNAYGYEDLGGPNNKWKNFHLIGSVNPNSTGKGVKFPDTSTYDDDKTLAIVDDIPSKATDVNQYQNEYVNPKQVRDYQVVFGIAPTLLTNINGHNLSYIYATRNVIINGYPGVQIYNTSDSSNLTFNESHNYMRKITGSNFTPTFGDGSVPQFSYIVGGDGTIYKPQWDQTNGLVLYKVNKLALKDSTIEYIDFTVTASSTLFDLYNACFSGETFPKIKAVRLSGEVSAALLGYISYYQPDSNFNFEFERFVGTRSGRDRWLGNAYVGSELLTDIFNTTNNAFAPFMEIYTMNVTASTTLADLYNLVGGSLRGVRLIGSVTGLFFGYVGYYAQDDNYNYEFEEFNGVNGATRKCWSWNGRAGSTLLTSIFSTSDQAYCPIVRTYVNP